MRVRLVPAVVLAVLTATGAAYAAQTASGAIKSIDPSSHRLVLENGTSYSLPATFHNPGLKAGDRVSITWDGMQNGMRSASAVTRAN